MAGSQRRSNVITGENYSLETVDPSEGVTVVLTFEAQPIWVTLVTHT